jgi:hypothetical protein
MHEFVLSARNLKREHGITALDVAKRLMDYGIHPPTVYFPLVVPEALMIEPTETEPKERLDHFVDSMLAIAREAAESPEVLKEAPHGRPVRRLDEVRAAKRPILRTPSTRIRRWSTSSRSLRRLPELEAVPFGIDRPAERPIPSSTSTVSSTSTPALRNCASIASRSGTVKLIIACFSAGQ